MNESETFDVFLTQIRDGVFAGECTEHFRALVAALEQAERVNGGKPKGRLTLTIDFKLDGGIVEVLAVATPKLPKLAVARSLFYATREHGLSQNNPKQLELSIPPRDVSSTPARELRSI